jgi:hypothetical protein
LKTRVEEEVKPEPVMVMGWVVEEVGSVEGETAVMEGAEESLAEVLPKG